MCTMSQLLPLECNEEAALLDYFRKRLDAGQSGGHVLPLYLLHMRAAAAAVSVCVCVCCLLCCVAVIVLL
jgi:hypothetical protein